MWCSTTTRAGLIEAYEAVKSNGGAAGVDGQTIEQFEADLKKSQGWWEVEAIMSYSTISSTMKNSQAQKLKPAFFLSKSASKDERESADLPRACVSDPRQSRDLVLGSATPFS
jgi:hypothetical protein